MSSFWKNIILWFLSFALITAGLVYRFSGFGFYSGDMDNFLIGWYGYLLKNGYTGLSVSFSDYTPFYTYLLYLATKLFPLVCAGISIKFIGLAFDLLSSFIICLVTLEVYRKKTYSLLAGSIFFVLPTVFLNSGFWGQADGIYTTFLLAGFYFIIKERPGWGMLSFAASLATKLQAVFFAPFLLVLSLHKKMPWKNYLLLPAVYVLFALPAALIGRPMKDLLLVYISQAGEYPELYLNAPSIFPLIEKNIINIRYGYLILAALVITGAWILASRWRINPNDRGHLALTALASVTLVPYILPRMHDRYFYPADVFSFVVAIFYPKFWFLPFMFQFSSYLVYSNYLFVDGLIEYQQMLMAAKVNAIALIVVLLLQLVFRPKTSKEQSNLTEI